MPKYEVQLFQFLEQLKNNIRIQPVILGGGIGSGGGIGGPPGGFIGVLPQTRVAFDLSELAVSGIPASGASLLDNLNRIRYNLAQKNPEITIKDETSTIATGVTQINFTGPNVTATASGTHVDVTISGGVAGSGGGGGETVKVTSSDTISNYLDAKVTVAGGLTKQVNNPGGNENLQISTASTVVETDQANSYTAGAKQQFQSSATTAGLNFGGVSVEPSVLVTGDLWYNTTSQRLFYRRNTGNREIVARTENQTFENKTISSTVNSITSTSQQLGDLLKNNGSKYVRFARGSANQILAVNASGTDLAWRNPGITVQEDSILTASGVTIVNFEGDVITTNVGGGKVTVNVTASGSDDKKVKISSDDITPDFIENKIVAGTNVTVAVINPGGNETFQINASGGGGSPLTVKDEGVTVATGVTSIDFVGADVIASGSGSSVTVTISGISGGSVPFHGFRYHRATDYTVTTNNSWFTLDFNGNVYDTDNYQDSIDLWKFNIPSGQDGYYNVVGHITFSGDMPTSDLLAVGIWANDATSLISRAIDGYFGSATGTYTIIANTDYYLNAGDNVNLRLFCGGTANPVVVSGIGNSYFQLKRLIPTEFVGARAREGSGQTISDTTDTVLTMSTEVYDTTGIYNSGNGRFTIPTGYTGKWTFIGHVTWETSNQGYRKVWWRKNGSTVLAISYDDPSNLAEKSIEVVTDVELSAGDYVELVVWHNKGSNSNVLGGGDSITYGQARYMGT